MKRYDVQLQGAWLKAHIADPTPPASVVGSVLKGFGGFAVSEETLGSLTLDVDDALYPEDRLREVLEQVVAMHFPDAGKDAVALGETEVTAAPEERTSAFSRPDPISPPSAKAAGLAREAADAADKPKPTLAKGAPAEKKPAAAAKDPASPKPAEKKSAGKPAAAPAPAEKKSAVKTPGIDRTMIERSDEKPKAEAPVVTAFDEDALMKMAGECLAAADKLFAGRKYAKAGEEYRKAKGHVEAACGSEALYEYYYARAVAGLARVYAHTERDGDKSLRYRKSASEAYQKVEQRHPVKYAREAAEAYYEYGTALVLAGSRVNAKAEFIRACDTYISGGLERTKGCGVAFCALGELYALRGSLAQTEAYYNFNRSISILHELCTGAPGSEIYVLLAKTYIASAQLSMHLKRHEDALRSMQAAIECFEDEKAPRSRNIKVPMQVWSMAADAAREAGKRLLAAKYIRKAKKSAVSSHV